MKDTRILNILETLDAADRAADISVQDTLRDVLKIIDELSEDVYGPTPDGIALHTTQRYVEEALETAGTVRTLLNMACKSLPRHQADTERECGAHNTVGSRCVQPSGHDGEHRSAYGATWTDESNRRAAAAIAASMEGRRD